MSVFTVNPSVMTPDDPYENRHRRAHPCTTEYSRAVFISFHRCAMHCAHFSFALLGPHKGFLNLGALAEYSTELKYHARAVVA